LIRSSDAGVELHLLALRGGIVGLARNDPMWTKIHFLDPYEKGAYGRKAAVLRELRAARFDASLSFFPSNNSQYNLLPLLCGVRRRFAYRYALKQARNLAFLNTDLVDVDPLAHDVEQNLRLAARFMNVRVPAGPHRFPSLVTEKSAGEARRLLAQNAGPQVYIGVHPGSSTEQGMGNKRWEPARFGELASRICNRLGARALIFGSAYEEDIKQATASAMTAPYRLVAPTELAVTESLLRHCTVMLANDSGLMHMAACAGVPTAGIFGPTDERRAAPVGSGSIVIRKPMQGFPVWTASNVGVRAVAEGVDPQASLKALSVADAWAQMAPWLDGLKGDVTAARSA
jgi:ADP-heptose:LPS heptosyltransferase